MECTNSKLAALEVDVKEQEIWSVRVRKDVGIRWGDNVSSSWRE